MSDFIEAMTILLKYGNPDRPFQCVDDMLQIWGISPDIVSKEDLDRLNHLGVRVDAIEGESSEMELTFYSYRFGKC